MIWTILGISVAIIATYCVCLAEVLLGNPIFEAMRPDIAKVLAGGGVVALAVGVVIGIIDRRRDAPVRFLLFDLRYWGPVLLVLSSVTFFVRPLKLEASARTLAPAAPPPEPVVTNTPVPLRIKVQGVIYRESRPFVIINKQSYSIGDTIGDAVVRRINRDSVELEVNGERHVVPIE